MKTVLLAEHHRPTREHLAGQLSQSGYQVTAVAEPGAAMDRFVAERPEALVVAVDFPKLDGSHLCQLVRGSDRGARVLLVAIDKGHLGSAKGVGAILALKVNAYVADPLRGNELVQKLEQLAKVQAPPKEAPQSGIAATLSRRPVAAGELRGHPLPVLLHSMFRLQRDGILVATDRDLTRRVFFRQGAPVAYDSTARQDAFLSFLIEQGSIAEEEIQSVLEAQARGQMLSEALGLVRGELRGEGLLQLCRDYVRDRVAQLVGMREGRYAFYAGAEFEHETSPVEVPALAPILEGARRAFPLKVFSQSLRHRMGEYPQRTAQFGKDLSQLGLNTKDLSVAMQMNGRIALKDLLVHGRGELPVGLSLMWFLALTGAVEFSKAPISSSNGAYGEQDRLGPRKKKPLPPERAALLRDEAVKIITGSYFRVLGLDIAADTAHVEKAYREIAARFHPDSYAEFDVEDLQDLLTSVQDKLNASYKVLSVEDKRKAYLQYLFSRAVVRATAVNVDAEIALKRGEEALRRRDLAQAQAAFEQAVVLNPREPEYYCYLAWAQYQASGGLPEDRAKAAQKLLKKALTLNPYLERALVISAIIEAERGDLAAAKKKLRRVLELNPASVTAKAALRRFSS